MTPERASAIAHGSLAFHNPLSDASLGGLLELLPLRPGDRVVDVGCGRGELLIRIAERTGAGGLGIDTSEELIAGARAEAAARVPGAELTFELGDAGALAAPVSSFALASCIGSTHALGGLQPALGRLVELARPGGHVVVGEGYWPQEPSDELLELLGAARAELVPLSGLLAAGEPHGLSLVYAATANDEDWRRYEWSYVFNLDRHLRDHPDAEGGGELRGRLERIRARRLLAAREGEGLGFALLAWRCAGRSTPLRRSPART